MFVSTPCQTNSRCSVTNNSGSRGEACGYRDWGIVGHPPFPAMHGGGKASVGFTSSAHRLLAMTHVKLERRVIRDLEAEAPSLGTSYSLENPFGSILYKLHTQA